MNDKATTPKGDRAVGRLEWAVGIAGALATLAVLGVLVREAVTYQEGAPVLISTVTGVTPTPAGYVVQFQTENRSPSTVAEVVVDARLKQGDRVLEQASVTLDYVARKSSRDAGVILRADPASGTLELSASSFRAP
ncbi:TIGR02588 family protein [Hansschlegelia quercus]|uniref:TIGR02588 family protein n=1 Tax=Hansschlegelia quercus TaxID=2528245 RepID=A0A4Q9GSD2_9HYPH|nr:TIGR02588 family protein [Hansschlegelia quercus]TBN54707.1 TIGR02588 family protein [Hansschlegelia quercus]